MNWLSFIAGLALGALACGFVSAMVRAHRPRMKMPAIVPNPGSNHPIASLADQILAGNRNWAEPTMDMEVGAACRAQTAALAIAIKHMRDKQQ